MPREIFGLFFPTSVLYVHEQLKGEQMMKQMKHQIFFTVFLLSLTHCVSAVMAEPRCIVPTVTKNVAGIENMLELKLDPSNPDEINPDQTITVKVIGGCPPFDWEDPGHGYSWIKESPTYDRSNQLHCDSGT
jgi:hypothetical protein